MAILVFNTFSASSSPLLLDSTGEKSFEVDFELDDYVEAHGSCTVTLGNNVYLLGGVQQKRQISRLNGCRFERIGSTQFDFSYGTCGTYEENQREFALLCFDHNHPYLCYVMTETGRQSLSHHELEYDTDNPHDYARLSRYSGYPFVLGSKYGSHNRAEMLTSLSGRWSQLPAYPFHDNIYGYATVTYREEVFIFGGYVGRYGEVSTMAKFDMDRKWIHLGQLYQRRHGHSAVITSSGKDSQVLIIGGEGDRNVERHSITGHEATETATILSDYKYYPELMIVNESFCS